jgi:hypothetical protein
MKSEGASRRGNFSTHFYRFLLPLLVPGMADLESIPVYIRDHHGAYLAFIGDAWDFTPDRSLAWIFDYHDDDVPAQLEQAHREFGVLWTATPVDSSLAGERCDACGCTLRSAEAHFDGSRYLCNSCWPGLSD